MTKVAQKLTTFWALVENIAFVPKTAVTSFGLPWEKLGYFLLQHLVTLHATAKSQNLREKVFFEILGQPRPLSFIFQLLLFHK